jgi:ABC-type transporter Mla MlaB component
MAVRPGEHACCRFAHAADRRRIAGAFVAGALSAGQKVVYMCDDDPEAFAAALAELDDRVRPAIERGQLDLRPCRSAYMPDGTFDVERVLTLARDEHARALAEGYPALSFIGEMAWLGCGAPGSDLLTEYERRLDEVMGEGSIVALCQYGHDHLDAATLSDVAAAHTVDLSPELAALSRDGALSGARVDQGRGLRLSGELDFGTADTLAAVLDAHFHGPLRLDLEDLSYVDVAGMRALRGRTGQSLTIAGASAPVLRLLGLLGWDTDPGVEVVAAA